MGATEHLAPITVHRETHVERERADPLESFLAEQSAARRRIFKETLGDELATIIEQLEAGLDLDEEEEGLTSVPLLSHGHRT